MYVGGKNGSGVYQKIINLIPPHRIYIEGFLGSGAILRKKTAEFSIGCDLDQTALDLCKSIIDKNGGIGSAILINEDTLEFLAGYKCEGEEFIYLDPPYLMGTRAGREYYNHEMTDEQHVELLRIIKELDCMVLTSGYASEMYDEALKDWNREQFTAQTRGGPATETVWYNYPQPYELHEYTYLGDNYRERERITRKQKRWKNRLEQMDRLERLAIMQVLQEFGR